MYEIVYFTDFSSLSLTVYKQQLQIVHESFTHESFHTSTLRL